MPPPELLPGSRTSAEDSSGVSWLVERDVLRRSTTCRVSSSDSYDVPHDGRATESYAGAVSVDTRSFEQCASADCSFSLAWPGTEVRVRARMEVLVTGDAYDVTIDAEAHHDGERVATRGWRERLPR
jgi:hypothetical protein